MQKLQSVDVVALDKTGTLTQGSPEVTEIIVTDGLAEDDVLKVAASVEQHSEHPLAQAIVGAAQARGLTLCTSAKVTAHAGRGIEACTDEHHIQLGSQRFMTEIGACTARFSDQADIAAQSGQTPIFLAVSGRCLALFVIADTVRYTTPAAIDALKTRGLEVVMITGDTEATAKSIAQDLGISNVIAGVLPGGKSDAVRALQAQSGIVAFVGDGINDAPALAQADVGIAIGTGTDVAIETADVVLMSPDINGVVNALDISAATMRNIRQNLGWAFGYNVLLIPVAAGVLVPFGGPLLSPMLAAGAMALSSVFVVTNALRLRWVRPEVPQKGALS